MAYETLGIRHEPMRTAVRIHGVRFMFFSARAGAFQVLRISLRAKLRAVNGAGLGVGSLWRRWPAGRTWGQVFTTFGLSTASKPRSVTRRTKLTYLPTTSCIGSPKGIHTIHSPYYYCFYSRNPLTVTPRENPRKRHRKKTSKKTRNTQKKRAFSTPPNYTPDGPKTLPDATCKP